MHVLHIVYWFMYYLMLEETNHGWYFPCTPERTNYDLYCPPGSTVKVDRWQQIFLLVWLKAKAKLYWCIIDNELISRLFSHSSVVLQVYYIAWEFNFFMSYLHLDIYGWENSLIVNRFKAVLDTERETGGSSLKNVNHKSNVLVWTTKDNVLKPANHHR